MLRKVFSRCVQAERERAGVCKFATIVFLFSKRSYIMYVSFEVHELNKPLYMQPLFGFLFLILSENKRVAIIQAI